MVVQAVHRAIFMMADSEAAASLVEEAATPVGVAAPLAAATAAVAARTAWAASQCAPLDTTSAMDG